MLIDEPELRALVRRMRADLRSAIPRAALDSERSREVVALLDPSLDDASAAIGVARDARDAGGGGRGVEVDAVRELQRCANIIEDL